MTSLRQRVRETLPGSTETYERFRNLRERLPLNDDMAERHCESIDAERGKPLVEST